MSKRAPSPDERSKGSNKASKTAPPTAPHAPAAAALDAPPRFPPPGVQEDIAQDAAEPWLFVQLADPQLGMHTSDPSDPDDGWEQEAAMLDLAVAKINELKPKFAIVCGDLVHEFPAGVGERAEDPARFARQNAALQAGLARVRPDVPLVCLCARAAWASVPRRASTARVSSEFVQDWHPTEMACERDRV
mmetsp:Transcript_24789/g.74359  ORF Transcript_24789/g.74359 Transcript_24789/m.74359 type:complete len:190 (+) Transcript_24789:89-658(+)